jgi:hypothetical protein
MFQCRQCKNGWNQDSESMAGLEFLLLFRGKLVTKEPMV